MRYSFGQCQIDTQTYTLTVASCGVPIEYRQFHLLQILAQANNDIVSRDTLMLQLWPEQIVSDASLSRLVSDTRKLIGDDGKIQHLIKTCHDGGFSLNLRVTQTPAPLIAPFTPQLWPAIALGVLTIVLLIMIMNNVINAPSKSHRSDYQMILAISQQLAISKTAMGVQFERRNELGTMLNIARTNQRIFWEKEFSAAYPRMNTRQLFVFDQIRGITEGPLLSANSKIAEILRANPHLNEQIPSFTPLLNHLNFWLAKYHHVFKIRQDMCLLYVGVEDSLPFPKTVDQDVETWLKSYLAASNIMAN